jgi:hypothetical protein
MLTTTIRSLSVPLLLLATQAQAQVPPPVDLPTPRAFVRQLDLECRPAHGAPPAPTVGVRQLNPVLKDKIPNQITPLGELEEVCVPVAKNGQIPGPAALEIIRWVDVACYRATSPHTGVELDISHLNPQLANLPDEKVKMGQLEQVCLPVSKNGSVLPPAIKRIVSHFDVGCYGLEGPTRDADRTLVLDHLNPVILGMGQPDHVVTMRRPHQLCVPIAKNNQPVPPGVLPFIEWADFLKYRVEPQQPIPVLPLWLTHLNPLYSGQAPFFTVLEPDRVRLMVPVAKNGHLPPGIGD